MAEVTRTTGAWTCLDEDGTFASHEDAAGEWSHYLDDSEREESQNTASIAIRSADKVVALAVHADPAYIPGLIPELCANARLIAAAPDLLAACQMIVKTLALYRDKTANPLAKMCDKATAERMLADAIAKATGATTTEG